MGQPKIRKPGDLPEQTTDGRTGCSAASRRVLWIPNRAAACPAPRDWHLHTTDAATDGISTMSVTLHVCITCRAGQIIPEGEMCPGQKLHTAISVIGSADTVKVVGVECLSACSQGSAVALSGPGRWSYVYGRMTEADAAEIVAGAAAYAETIDGIVPWRERPAIFRKQSLARLPPMELA